jgi:hypothetical protein
LTLIALINFAGLIIGYLTVRLKQRSDHERLRRAHDLIRRLARFGQTGHDHADLGRIMREATAISERLWLEEGHKPRNPPRGAIVFREDITDRPASER